MFLIPFSKYLQIAGFVKILVFSAVCIFLKLRIHLHILLVWFCMLIWISLAKSRCFVDYCHGVFSMLFFSKITFEIIGIIQRECRKSPEFRATIWVPVLAQKLNGHGILSKEVTFLSFSFLTDEMKGILLSVKWLLNVWK